MRFNTAAFLLYASCAASFSAFFVAADKKCPLPISDDDGCENINDYDDLKDEIEDMDDGDTKCFKSFSVEKHDGDDEIRIRDKAVNIICADVGSCRIEGEGTLIEIEGDDAEVVIQGFHFRGATDSAIKIREDAGKDGDRDQKICDCEFTKNESKDHGGAIRMYMDTEVYVRYCVFSDNYSDDDGGAIHNDAGRLKVLDSKFEGNKAHNVGGAIATRNAGILILQDNAFVGNGAEEVGGAVVSSGRIDDEGGNTFRDNDEEEKCDGVYDLDGKKCRRFDGSDDDDDDDDSTAGNRADTDGGGDDDDDDDDDDSNAENKADEKDDGDDDDDDDDDSTAEVRADEKDDGDDDDDDDDDSTAEVRADDKDDGDDEDDESPAWLKEYEGVNNNDNDDDDDDDDDDSTAENKAIEKDDGDDDDDDDDDDSNAENKADEKDDGDDDDDDDDDDSTAEVRADEKDDGDDDDDDDDDSTAEVRVEEKDDGDDDDDDDDDSTAEVRVEEKDDGGDDDDDDDDDSTAEVRADDKDDGDDDDDDDDDDSTAEVMADDKDDGDDDDDDDDDDSTAEVRADAGGDDDEDDDDDDSNANNRVSNNFGPFQLKLYWDDSIRWQDKDKDFKFCMQCEDSCKKGNRFELKPCMSKKDDQQFYAIGKTIRHHKNRKLCMAHVDQRGVAWERCNGSTEQQWNQALERGKFMLEPVNNKENRCMTNHHHPRKNEPIYLDYCELAHEAHTAYWEAKFR